MKERINAPQHSVDLFALLNLDKPNKEILYLVDLLAWKHASQKEEIHTYYPFEYMKLSSQIFDERIAVVRLTKEISSFPFQLRLFLKTNKGKRIFEDNNKYRFIDRHTESPIFLLNLHLENKKYYVDNPLEMLAYYAIFLIKSGDFPSFGKLVENFRNHFVEDTLKPNKDNKFPEILKKYVVSTGSLQKCHVNVIRTILVVLGCLNHSCGEYYATKAFIYLSKITALLDPQKVRDLVGDPDSFLKDYAHLVPILIRGIGFVYYLEGIQLKTEDKRGEWVGKCLELVEALNIEQANPKDFLDTIFTLKRSSPNPFFTPKIYLAISDYLEVSYSLPLLSLAPNILIFTDDIYKYYLKHERENDILLKIRAAGYKYALKCTLSMKDLADVLFRSELWTENLLKSYYSGVRNQAMKTLEGCPTNPNVAATHIALAGRIFFKYPFYFYLVNTTPKQYCKDYIFKHMLSVNLKVIYDHYLSKMSEREQYELFEIWVNLHLRWNFKQSHHIISEIDNCFKSGGNENIEIDLEESSIQLTDQSISPMTIRTSAIFDMVIQSIWRFSPRQSIKQFLDVIITMNKCRCEEFKEMYISFVDEKFIVPMEQRILKNTQDSPYRILDQLRKSKVGRNNHIIDRLINIMQPMLEPPTQDLVFKNVFVYPSDRHYFYNVIEGKEKSDYKLKLAKIIIECLLKLKNYNVNLHIGMKIVNHNMKRQLILFSYTKMAMNVVPSTKLKPEEIIESLAIMINSIFTGKEQLNAFLGRYGDDLENSAKIQQTFRNFFSNYEKIEVSKFKYPSIIREYADLSKEYDHILFSEALDRVYKHTKTIKEVTPIDLKQVLLNCIKEILDVMKDILNKGKETKMKVVQEYFGDVTKLERPKIMNEVHQLNKFLVGEETERFMDLLLYYSVAADISHSCASIIRFLDSMNLKDPLTKNSCELYILDFNNLYDLTVEEFLTNTRNISKLLQYEQSEYQEIYSIMTELSKSKDLLDFLKTMSQDDIDNMKESVNEFDETFIQTQTVLNLVTVYFYVKQLTERNTYIDIKTNMYAKVSSPEFAKMNVLLEECRTNLQAFKSIFHELTKKEEAKKRKILHIMSHSILSIIRHSANKDEWDIELTYQSDKFKQVLTFDLSGILELRDRALLILNTEESRQRAEVEDNEGAIYMDVYREYIDFAKCACSIINSMNELEYSGYPIWEEVKSFPKFQCNNSSYKAFVEQERELNKQILEWKKFITTICYDGNYPMTHLFGKRFWVIENYIKTGIQSYQATNLLNFMHKDVKFILKGETYLNPVDNLQEYNMRIFNLAEYLSNIPDLYPPKITFGVKCRIEHDEGIVAYYETSNLIHGIISLFACRGEMPSANQLLFCSQNTSWQELMSFIYRAFLNSQHNIFLLVKANSLNRENQIGMFQLFEKLYYQRFDGRCRLAILATETTSRIAETFKLKNYTKVVRELDMLTPSELKKIIQRIDREKTLVVKSKSAGMGKTHFIMKDAQSKNLNLTFIPISGDVTLESIGTRLLGLEITQNMALCFQISVVTNQDILIEILIQVIIIRCFNNPMCIINFPPDIRIYIEIANTTGQRLTHFNNFAELFDPVELNEVNLEELEISNDCQIVCNHLLALSDGSIDEEIVMSGYFGDFLPKNNLPKKECINLLNKYFLGPRKGQELSYIQISLFINILAESLKSFYYSPFIPLMLKEMVTTQADMGPLCKKLRSVMVTQLMETTTEFTTKSIKNVKEEQLRAESGMEGREEENINMDNLYNDIITWESTNHFFLLFTKDGIMIPIYRNQSSVPISIKQFMSVQHGLSSGLQSGTSVAQTMETGGSKALKNYSNMKHLEFMEEIFRIINYEPINDPGYILTADNFLKMMLIYKRVGARIPVIIMGETGVGKTSLIRYLVKNILHEELRIYGIHAGVTTRHMLETINGYNEEAKTSKGRIWIFLDEFNTTDAIGLLYEVICNRKMLGKPLSDSLIFVAACNPYRMKNKKICFDENVGIRKDKLVSQGNKFRLLYTVHPLPETMLNYVWDFGELTPQDEQKYISTILEMSQHISPQHHRLFAPAVFAAHKYFKAREDISSVSLRDVQRYKTILEFFIHTMKLKTADYIANIDPILRAGILAIMHCYYLRLANKKFRRQFLSKLSLIFKMNVMKILEICEEEQNDYLKRMEFPREIAKNEALKENIFAMLVCIVNKIPIFVCGKPGCSKTLAISLLMANLRGVQSYDPFFRQLPELTKVYFQGSSSCTSESIIKAFENAENYLSIKTAEELLPVVVFDEIGLAEISKYNPLKVLHERLERENLKVGFIGISNWRLDASKMNRALYLARPDPDLDDLQYSAVCIYESINQGRLRFHLNIMKNLSKAYFEFKQELHGTPIEDLYGLRDFYHLIKLVAREFARLPTTHERELLRVVKFGLERNFDGNPEALNRILQIFIDIHKCEEAFSGVEESSALNLIESNLGDTDSRYLMVISQGDSGTFILERFLHNQIIENKVIVGSPFEEDLEKEEYGIKCLSDIILYMEKGVSIILKGLEDIYSSLYDLFNQSFAISGGRRRCRIALGALYNPNCLVHENFHCIIFMEKSRMDLQDPPFLNRFEKHFLSFEDILNRRQQEILGSLEEWITQVTTIQNNQPLITINHIFINYSKDKLGLLVLEYSEANEGNSSDQAILEQCKYELISLATPDLLVIASLSEVDKKEWDNLYNIYSQTHTQALGNILSNPEYMKSIIFTYSQSFPEDYSHIEGIKHRIMGNYKRETDLKRELNEFFASKDQVFIMEIDLGSESTHLSYFKYHITECIGLNVGLAKRIVIIVHMRRNIKYAEKYNIPLFEGWKQLFIENIAEENAEIYLTPEIINLNVKALIREKYKDKIVDILGELLEKCFLKINYDSKNIEIHSKVFNHVRNMCENIPRQAELMRAIREKAMKDIQMQPLKDWKENMFSDHDIFTTSTTTLQAFEKSIYLPVETALTKILFTLENKFALSSFFSRFVPQDLLQEIWLDYFRSLRIDPNLRLHNISQSLITPPLFDLAFPFSRYEFDKIQTLRKEYFAAGQSESQLIDCFRDSTILGKSYEKFATSRLQQPYFEDMIKLLLKDIYDPEYSYIIFFSFINNVENFSEHKFEEILIFFIERENLLINLVKMFKECAIFLEGSIADFMKTINYKQETFQKVEVFAYHIINKVLLHVFPKAIAFTQHNKPIQMFLFKLEKIQTQVKELIVENKLKENEENTTRLNFWIDFTNLVILTQQVQEAPAVLLNFGGKYFSTLQPEIFFYSEENHFMKDVNEYLDFAIRIESIDVQNCVYKFIANKSVSFIKNDPKNGIEYLTEINNLNLCAYLGSEFVAFLFSKLNLFEQLGRIIDYQNGELEIISDEEGYTDLIEAAIKSFGLQTIFSNYLHDYLCRNFDLLQHPSISDALRENNEKFVFWHKIYLNEDRRAEEFEGIKGLLGKAYISCFLEGYITLIANFNGSKEDFDIYRVSFLESERLLEEQNEIGEQMRMFCIESLMEKKKLSDNEIYYYVKKNENIFNWMKYIPVTCPTTPLSILPIIKNSKIESSRRVWFKSFNEILLYSHPTEQTLESLAQAISLISGTKYNRLGFLLGLLQSTAPYHCQHSGQIKYLKDWIDKNINKLIEKYGREVVHFANLIINNFPAVEGSISFLKLENEEEFKTHQKLVMQVILSITISFGSSPNPISSLFFANNRIGDEGDIYNIIQGMYAFGTLGDPIIEDYKTMLADQDNFQFQLYQCSHTCPFLYFIKNCGKADVKSICPICKQGIGGTDHKLIQRAGHEPIPKPNAKQFIMDRIKKLETNCKRGYGEVSPPSDSRVIDSTRSINPVTYRLLHLILHVNLKYIYQFYKSRNFHKIIVLGNLEGIGVERYIDIHIQKDFELLGKIINSNEPHIWLYKVIGEIPALLSNFRQAPSTLLIRNEFEKAVEDKIITPNRGNIPEVISNYKKQYNELGMNKKVSKGLNIGQNTTMFRRCKMGTYEEFEMNYNLGNNKKKYPLLSIFLQKQDDLERVQSLLPIVTFTNNMLEKFSYRLTREEARSKSLESYLREDDQQQMWASFEEAWKRANFVDGISYKCAHLKYTDVNLNNELIFFLVDTIERGNGLYMAGALYTLGVVHNNLLHNFRELYSLYNTDTVDTDTVLETDIAQEIALPIQSLATQDCIQAPPNFSRIQYEYSFNNPENRQGHEVIYDYPRIERELLRGFLGRKMVNGEELTTMEYQFELLQATSKHSTLIEDIRRSIPQTPLPRELEKMINRYLEQVVNRRNMEEYSHRIKEILGSLEYVLIHVKNGRFSPDESVDQFLNNINKATLSPLIQGQSPITTVKLSALVSLYEHMEDKYFLYLKEFIPSKYRSREGGEDLLPGLMEFEGVMKDCQVHLDIQILGKALRRFIMRCLIGDIDPQLPILYYLKRSDLWPAELGEDRLDELMDLFSPSILVKHAIYLDDLIQEKIARIPGLAHP